RAAAAILPTIVEYRSNMSKARRKITPVIPATVIFDIPESYQQTLSAKRFLLIDLFMTLGKDRILVFSSEQQLELLFESKTIFMDGTFDTTAPNFKQLYLIHAHKFSQGCFVFTRFLWLFILNMFHFNEAIHRKITDLGLSNDYLHNGSIRDQCCQLMALSLMPLIYFKHQWMHGVVPVHMWNFYNVNHRTNNTSEAYNLKFATRLARKHPNVWSFMQLIQTKHVRFEHISIQLDAGASAPKQSKKTDCFLNKIQYSS
ncbi:unnamed protein product, partial [Rotaria magnacalcarata]